MWSLFTNGHVGRGMKRYALAACGVVLLLASTSHAAPCDVEALFGSPLADQTIRQQILDAIGTAEGQILIAMSMFTDDEFGAALVEAHQRGVRVYLLTDETQNTESVGGLRRTLVAAGVSTAGGDGRVSIDPGFLVIDRRRVITATGDWSEPCETGEVRSVLIIDCTAIAQRFADAFFSIANDVLNAGWSLPTAASISHYDDPCEECLARLNEATQEDFEGCPGIDARLAFRLEVYGPYHVVICSRAALITVLLTVPGLEPELSESVVDCICDDLFD